MTHAATSTSPLLKYALMGDAAASGATGLLLAAGAAFLSPLLGFDASFMQTAGMILIPFAAFVAWMGTRHPAPRLAVWAIIAINVVWVIESGLTLTSGAHQPTMLGFAFVFAQAAVVLAFAIAQFVGLTRA